MKKKHQSTGTRSKRSESGGRIWEMKWRIILLHDISLGVILLAEIVALSLWLLIV